MIKSFKFLFIIIYGLINPAIFGVLAPGNFLIWRLLLLLIIKLVLVFLGLTFRTGFLHITRYRLL